MQQEQRKKKRSEKGKKKEKKKRKKSWEHGMCQKGPEGTVNNSSPVQRGAGFQEWGKDDITFCSTRVFLQASWL